jgi:hypothetical protein
LFLRCDLESVAPLMRALNKMTSVSIAPLTQRRSCDGQRRSFRFFARGETARDYRIEQRELSQPTEDA